MIKLYNKKFTTDTYNKAIRLLNLAKPITWSEERKNMFLLNACEIIER